MRFFWFNSQFWLFVNNIAFLEHPFSIVFTTCFDVRKSKALILFSFIFWIFEVDLLGYFYWDKFLFDLNFFSSWLIFILMLMFLIFRFWYWLDFLCAFLGEKVMKALFFWFYKIYCFSLKFLKLSFTRVLNFSS